MTKLNFSGEKEKQLIEIVQRDAVLLDHSHEKYKNAALFLEASSIQDFLEHGFIIFGCRRNALSPTTTCSTIILEPGNKFTSENLNDAFKIC